MFLAQEFDAVDEGGPYISADRRRIHMPDTRSRVFGYLATAPVAAPGLRTDGEWVWPESLADQVRSHGAAPQEQLYEHMRARHFLLPDRLPANAIQEAARIARGAATPDPARTWKRTYLGGFEDRDTPPVTLLRVVRQPEGAIAEYAYFRDGWDVSHFLQAKSPRASQALRHQEFGEISDREAAMLVDEKCESAHRELMAAAKESEESGGSLRVARVFDGQSPAGVPWFSPGRLRIPEVTRRERLAAYLSAGRLVVRATGRMVDPVDPSLGPVVPLNYRTDGIWVWQEALAYYVRTRGAAPELEFLCHIEERGMKPPVVVPDDAVAPAAALVLAGSPPMRARAPLTYYGDERHGLVRAREDSVFDAELLRSDLRWALTNELWEQRYQGEDHGYQAITEEEAVRRVDARWATGAARPPIN